MPVQTTRNLRTADGAVNELFLGKFTTSDATPQTVYTSLVVLPEGRVLEIVAKVLVALPDASAVSTFLKRGLFARATGGSLRLINSATSNMIGEINNIDVDVSFGVNGTNQFIISAVGKAATVYNWIIHIETLRNA